MCVVFFSSKTKPAYLAPWTSASSSGELAWYWTSPLIESLSTTTVWHTASSLYRRYSSRANSLGGCSLTLESFFDERVYVTLYKFSEANSDLIN